MVVDRQTLHGEAQSSIEAILKLYVEMRQDKGRHSFERVELAQCIVAFVSRCDVIKSGSECFVRSGIGKKLTSEPILVVFIPV